MKNAAITVLSALVIVLGLSIGSSLIERGNAQSIGAGPVTSTTLAGCPAPAAGYMNFCLVTNDPANASGIYATANGAAYFQIKAAGAAGVATFNGRTGNVLSSNGDYAFSQLSGQITALQLPNSVTCSMSATVGGSDTITLSSCK